ncbi:hypothetical protein [Pseudomonas sp. MYb398]|uniref:hypothetical protein n=1 Tax=Pseudomonas sp. MYb398 TaxID=2745385 RepID=UPI00309A0A03
MSLLKVQLGIDRLALFAALLMITVGARHSAYVADDVQVEFAHSAFWFLAMHAG